MIKGECGELKLGIIFKRIRKIDAKMRRDVLDGGLIMHRSSEGAKGA